jgi:signal peptidase I
MGKRVLLKTPLAIKSKRRALTIASTLFVALLVGGPSVLHFALGMSFSPVLTGSMTPFAEPGDLLISLPTKASTLVVGDVISVANKDTGAVYAHRIIEVRDQGDALRFVTKGDANPTPELDPVLVTADVDINKEIMTVRGLGAPLVYLGSEQGRQASITLVVVANVGLIFYLLQRRPKNKQSPSG